jgi:hypothetical protein
MAYVKRVNGNIVEFCKNRPNKPKEKDKDLEALAGYEYISETDQEVIDYLNSFNNQGE